MASVANSVTICALALAPLAAPIHAQTATKPTNAAPTPSQPAAPTTGAATPATGPVTDVPSPLKRVPLRLVRCYAGNELGCFNVIGDVTDLETGSVAAERLKARLDTNPLVGPGLIRSDFESGGPLNLLIVYDVSGSMKGDGMAFTRSALRDFIKELPPSVSTAVVPFEARGVAAGFEKARFVSAAEARDQLERIPEPSNGNTALYSAIDNGLNTLDKQAASKKRSIMLVVTDGVNDVHPERRDDKGLLEGEAGLATARDHIAASKHSVWLLGAGFPDSTVLRTLAGSAGQARFAEMDPGSLARILRAIRSEMTPTRMMVYAIPAVPRADLGRRRRTFRLGVLKDSLIGWRPPLVALPVFEGAADSTLLLVPRVREMANDIDSPLNQRLFIAVPLLALLLVAHWALPRMVGATGSAAGTAASRAEEDADELPVASRATAPKSAAKSNAAISLRTVKEAPPRTPGDITKDAAI